MRTARASRTERPRTPYPAGRKALVKIARQSAAGVACDPEAALREVHEIAVAALLAMPRARG